MGTIKPPRPTDAELGILRILWNDGPSTVRAVQQALQEVRPTGYTTVLKLMQIMTEKGLVTRDESQRSHIYKARYRQDQTQKQLVADLMSRAFGGAADELVMQALRAKKVSQVELAEIRKVLDELEGADS